MWKLKVIMSIRFAALENFSDVDDDDDDDDDGNISRAWKSIRENIKTSFAELF
jgi:hypothetical protein